MFDIGDSVRSLKTGLIGTVIEIYACTKKKYPVVVTFDKDVINGRLMSEYEIVTCTHKGWLDWRYSNTLDIIKI